MVTTLSGVAAIGGGVASFASSMVYSQPEILPPFDYEGTHLMAQCARLARTQHQVSREQFRKILDEAIRSENSITKGALFCRSGTWLEIVDRRTAVHEAHRKRQQFTEKQLNLNMIRGTRSQNSTFSVLEFISIAFGLVSIRGEASGNYLCMNRKGELYGAPYEGYSGECVFYEEMMENYYNLYSSCAYGWSKRPWYVSLRKSGKPRRGNRARRRKKSAHFLVVHFDQSHFGSRQKFGDGKPSIQISRERARQEHAGYAKGSAWYEHFLNKNPPVDSAFAVLKPPAGVSLDDVLLNTLNVRRSPRTTYNVFENDRRLTDRRRLNARRRAELNGIPYARRERRRRRRKERLQREQERRDRRRHELFASSAATRAHRVRL